MRSEFLLDPDVVYLNHGAFGACPRPVFERYQAWQLELERQPVEFIARRLEEGNRPALEPREVAEAVAEMLASEDTGFIRTIIHGKGVQDFEFRAGVMPPPGT